MEINYSQELSNCLISMKKSHLIPAGDINLLSNLLVLQVIGAILSLDVCTFSLDEISLISFYPLLLLQ